jgi:hypothetical protein
MLWIMLILIQDCQRAFPVAAHVSGRPGDPACRGGSALPSERWSSAVGFAIRLGTREGPVLDASVEKDGEVAPCLVGLGG